MNTDTPTPNGSADSSHHRRSREEVEALAKNFVGTQADEAGPAKKGARIAMAAGAVVIVAILAVALWPKGRSEADRAAAESTRAAAAADAEQWQKRFEAERERKRQELASGQEYLSRMAAADAALLKDIGEQASRLAERAAALPAPSDAPTPRGETRTAAAKPAPAPSQPAPAPAQQAPTQTASAAPAKPAAAPAQAPQPEAAKPAPAEAAPQQVAQADKSQCTIHVSELTKSGKLTYADVKRMKGARIDEETGHVFTPPVQAAGGRSVIFEVLPNGCVTVRRS